MATEIIMPKLGLTMEEGTISSWLAKEGQTVKAGDTLLAIETDKVTVDVEAPASGILLKILQPEGSTVPVAQVIGYIGQDGEEIPQEVKPSSQPQKQPVIREQPLELAAASNQMGKPISISPIARKLAASHQIDISRLKGSGPGGRIVEKDILALIETGERLGISDPPFRSVTLSSLQKTMAERMSRSFQHVPHFYLRREIMAAQIVESLQRMRAHAAEEQHSQVTITDFLIQAVAGALLAHPYLNAAWHTDAIHLYQTVNIGLAVATEKGLMVPVLRDAQRKSVMQIAAERSTLAEKARANRLAQEDISGGTFTLTNLGMLGIDEFSPIINPPQSAILAVGNLKEKPVAENGEIALRPTIIFTLAADHRVVDGAQGAAFLATLAKRLAEA